MALTAAAQKIVDRIRAKRAGGDKPYDHSTDRILLLAEIADIADGLSLGPGGAPDWGDINGTLSNQTDLQNALNAKANAVSPTLSGNGTFETLDSSGAGGLNINSLGVLEIKDGGTFSGANNSLYSYAGNAAASHRTALGLGSLATQSGTFSGTSSGTNTGDQTTVSGNAGTATALATARAIYGNNFDGTAALTQVIASTYGGTGNGFTKFSGPTTAERTKTLRDATDTILELGGSYTPTGTWTSLTMVTPVLGTPTSGVLSGCTGYLASALSGNFNGITFNTGLGAVTQLKGPLDQPLQIAATIPTQTASAVAGNGLTLLASNAIAGSSNVGAAAGGAVTITAGDAARLTSGGAAGGAVTISSGSGLNGTAGGVMTLQTLGTVYPAGALNVTSGQGGAVNIVSTDTGSSNAPGLVTIRAGAATGNSATPAAGAAIAITTQSGGGMTNAGTGGAGGGQTITLGGGGAASSNGGGTGGAAGTWAVTGGTGGAATGTGNTHTGGAGSSLNRTAGTGGAATTASGTRTGGAGGSITETTGTGGAGSTTNGNGGEYTVITGAGGGGAGTAGTTGSFTVKPGNTTAFAVTGTGAVLGYSATAGMGYGTGAGGTVTQVTNRSTGVTINKVCGTITTDTTSLAALASASFTVTNSAVAISDVIILNIRSGQTNKKTKAVVTAVAAGSFEITIDNQDAITAEVGAIVINFAVNKAVTA